MRMCLSLLFFFGIFAANDVVVARASHKILPKYVKVNCKNNPRLCCIYDGGYWIHGHCE